MKTLNYPIICMLIAMFFSQSCTKKQAYSKLTMLNKKLIVGEKQYKVDWAIVETPKETKLINIVITAYSGELPKYPALVVKSEKDASGNIVYSSLIEINSQEFPIKIGKAYKYNSGDNSVTILEDPISMVKPAALEVAPVLDYANRLIGKNTADTRADL